jgi:hypothetical protein
VANSHVDLLSLYGYVKTNLDVERETEYWGLKSNFCFVVQIALSEG